MQLDKLVFVDVETTGTDPVADRVIDIGVILVDNGQVSQVWESLVNPQQHISSFISTMTGIYPQDVVSAPLFEGVIPQLLKFFENRIFVAHNARFDYSFLKQEFVRNGENLDIPQLCTVRLSRALYPTFRKHNLDSLIERFKLPVQKRHRALPDAQATFLFFNKMQEQFGDRFIEAHVQPLVKRPSLPSQLSSQLIDDLPNTAGVYIFYGSQDQPLYIGKSVHIKERVLSHFYSDLHSVKEARIKDQINHIETITTAGEIEALLLESQMIKKLFPLYNQRLRYRAAMCTMKINKDRTEYYQVDIDKKMSISWQDLDRIYGIFKSQKQARKELEILASQYHLCLKYLQLEKTSHACFGFHLKQCLGACTGQEQPDTYNARLEAALSPYKIKQWPFENPIVFKEYNLHTEQTAWHIFYKWCHLKTVHDQNDLDHLRFGDLAEFQFDIDVFYILKRFIFDTKRIQYQELPLKISSIT